MQPTEADRRKIVKEVLVDQMSDQILQPIYEFIQAVEALDVDPLHILSDLIQRAKAQYDAPQPTAPAAIGDSVPDAPARKKKKHRNRRKKVA